jgi:tRNA G18 (ribose-2'-O)-methylase SpoU
MAAALGGLRGGGITCLAASPHGAAALDAADLARDCCLVVGHEGSGVRPEVVAACDGVVAIPMGGAVDSLNVAAATAVLLYEAVRQRRARQG